MPARYILMGSLLFVRACLQFYMFRLPFVELLCAHMFCFLMFMYIAYLPYYFIISQVHYFVIVRISILEKICRIIKQAISKAIKKFLILSLK